VDSRRVPITRFVYADDRMPLSMIMGRDTYYLTYDQVGSLRIVADVSGNVVKRIDYDSFGSIINDTNPSFEVPFGFAGGLHDRDTGLVTFGFRDYDPEVGRWTAKDPIGFVGGDIDLYGYCVNDPIKRLDPYGLFGWADMPMLPQWIVDAAAGFGDGVSSILTFGLLSTADIRNAWGIGGVNPCSNVYKGSKYAGYVWGGATLWAAGLNGGSTSVFWSGHSVGARSSAEGLGTTLGQTPIGGMLEFVQYDVGISLPKALWKAASATFAANASGTATAVILSNEAGNLWATFEAPILSARGISILFAW
jgi:RHS repeat-associated protein